jgi:hypothetical protein
MNDEKERIHERDGGCRYVWCEEPFKFTFEGGTLKVEAIRGEIQTGKQGNNLRDIFH